MINFGLRTKFLLSLLLVSAGVTSATLWMVGKSLRVQLRQQIAQDLRDSVVVLGDFQRQREISLASSVELLANLPSLKALMTTRDSATIQDASASVWRLAPSDVFVLADPLGRVVALHTTTPGITHTAAQELLMRSVSADQPSVWWYGAGHLYQVFLRPIYFGGPERGSALGVLGVGHEISQGLASDVSRVVASDVAFFYGDTLVVSTLRLNQQPDIAHLVPGPAYLENAVPAELSLDGETFLATTVQLVPSLAPFVRLSVLKSYDKASVFLGPLDRVLVGSGVLAVLAGSTAVFFISFTFTRPLANLVSKVRKLNKGDLAFPLAGRSIDETAELTAAFDHMRVSLQRTQLELMAADRLATIGRTASSISHDLRHPLTAVVANAEFLCENELSPAQREELYREIRTAVDQMTGLIDSLLEFAHSQESLRRVFAGLEPTIKQAIDKVRAHPDLHTADISIQCEDRCETWFDHKKVERALVNLLLNGCESVSRDHGKIIVNLRQTGGHAEIRIVDNGPGIPEPIRAKLFEPFVSYGKQNGTGLGLAIAQKIFQDHGGDICLEHSEPGRTIFKLTLPILDSDVGVIMSDEDVYQQRST